MNIMKLIVMRHGEAETSNTSDKTRNLTSHGRRQTKDAAKWLSNYILINNNIDLALVSPYVRTQQTFECLMGALHIKQKIDVPQLVPNAKPQVTHMLLDGFLRENSQLKTMILVSHMPLISFLVDELLLSQHASLFDTSSMAIIDYDINTSSGVLAAFYHPCMPNFELK